MYLFDTGFVVIDLHKVNAIERGEFFPSSGDYEAIAIMESGERINTNYKLTSFRHAFETHRKRWWQFWR
ncbi:MAG TPA: hypothetical protein VET48_04930 [Steroidobacteraceae bacterium]|nr:hypothetical protein [Steroidobacteraceae bacterium]